MWEGKEKWNQTGTQWNVTVHFITNSEQVEYKIASKNNVVWMTLFARASLLFLIVELFCKYNFELLIETKILFVCIWTENSFLEKYKLKKIFCLNMPHYTISNDWTLTHSKSSLFTYAPLCADFRPNVITEPIWSCWLWFYQHNSLKECIAVVDFRFISNA